MDRARVDREKIINLLNSLLLEREDAAAQLRAASALAWIGIQARGRDSAVRGRLNAAAQGRVGAIHFLALLEDFASLSLLARRETALGLGDLAGGVAVSQLARLASARDMETRLIAVDALGKIGGPAAVSALKTAAGDVNETVRAEALRSLGQLAVAEADSALPEKAKLESWFLDVIAIDPSEYVREVAGDSLSALRESKSRRSRSSLDRIPTPTTSVSA
jgi:HEAT repeat protein